LLNLPVSYLQDTCLSITFSNNHMRVIFIQNLGINESLALTELSACLKREGHACSLIIENDVKKTAKAVLSFSPDIFIIPWDIGTLSWTLNTASWLKSRFKKNIILCGTYPSFYPENAISSPGVDAICIGETECAIPEYLKKIEKGKDPGDTRNFWIKTSGGIQRNSLRPLIDNLDILPLPDRNIYFRYPYLRGMSMKRFTSGRGCANSCRFCYNPLLRKRYSGMGPYVRKKSVSRVISEIKDVREHAALNSVHFSDDIFISDRDWIFKFAVAYKEQVNLPFTCNATADLIDEDIVIALKKANCRGIAIGIESGNEDYRKYILNKDLSDSVIHEAAGLIKKQGLFMATFNMIALPGETPQDVIKAIRLNADIGADHVRLSFASPLPGTELAEYGLKKGFFDNVRLKKMLDDTIYPKEAVCLSEHKRELENLFILFRFAVMFPGFIPLAKKLCRLPFIKLLAVPDMLINSYKEKKFFSITWLSGIKYMLKAGGLRKRTKVFNNFMP
ncbi:MAG: radical SAM protein, partial [Elusimicrobiota bacterium]